MQVVGWITTDKVGSRATFEVDIPDEDLEGKNEEERGEVIDTYVREEMWNHAEWGWKAAE